MIHDVRALRARLHDLAERSGEEERTAETIASFLADHGLHVEHDIGGHGLLVRIGGAGPARLLRADLDGLAHDDGARHGCGHDGHMAMLAGGLVALAKDPPQRPVLGFFQPSEENGAGMARCLQDPRLADEEIRDAFAIHNLPGYRMGSVVLGPGALASTGIRVRLTGREAHAAHPDEGRSPWDALRGLADAVPALGDGLGKHALATLIHVRLGEEAYGTSPGRGMVSATLRGHADDVDAMRERWLAGLPERLQARVDEVDPFPETANDDAGVAAARQAADASGLDVESETEPFPWSEDFGHAVARWGGALVGLGSGRSHPPLHDDRYEFPDALVEPGVRFWTALGRQT